MTPATLRGARASDRAAVASLLADASLPTDLEPDWFPALAVVATLANLRSLFRATLDVAGPDDVVILSFTGHGTADHRLVVADTHYDAIVDTTIAMSELAERFCASQARAVFCILDCCFSGGAPARVLDDVPRLRDVGVGRPTPCRS